VAAVDTKEEWSGAGFKIRAEAPGGIQIDLESPQLAIYQAFQLADALVRAGQWVTSQKVAPNK